MLHPVIMAGGSGTRFWPRSRLRRPKQLIQIVGRGTMIQQTVARLRFAAPPESFLIITNVAQADEMRRQLPELAPGQIVAEPVGRDTSAAIGLAAAIIGKSDPEGIMAVFSADHIIAPAEELARCTKEAARIAADNGVLATFGVKPTCPSERYGYIRRGEPLKADIPAFKIAEFKEKPDRAQAEEFLRTGEYYWNSGNFVWRVKDILDAFREYLPDLHEGLERIGAAFGTSAQDKVLAEEYPRLPRTSIDYGVMEKAPNAVVVEATFAWDDVGAWDAVARHQTPDSEGNFLLGKSTTIDAKNCIMVSAGDHLLATIGVEDLIVVHTPDATLVCDRGRAADVKKLVEMLKAQGLDAYV